MYNNACILVATQGITGNHPRGGTPHIKGVGMLVLWGFWSHLGCSEQNAIIFSCEGLV